MDLIHSITPEQLDKIADRITENMEDICPPQVLQHSSIHGARLTGLLKLASSYQKAISSMLLHLEQLGFPNENLLPLSASSTKLHIVIR
jgi:hypothetical protein